MNRPSDRTIYPAVAEAWFDAVYLLNPGSSATLPYQVAAVVVDMATIGLIALLLTRSGRDPRQVAWYALSPVPVIEFAGNGHVDGLALLLLLAALLALERGRRGLAGFLIGLATMVKLYPAIGVVAAWRSGRWRMLLVAGATCVVTEAPHVVAVGLKILGYLPGYLKEEKYEGGGRFLMVGLLGLPGKVDTALAVLIVVVACIWALRSPVVPAVALAVLMTVVILVTTPVQPWYAVTLAGLGAAVGAWWLVLPALAAEPYYATVILHDRHQVGWGRVCYGSALILLLVAWRTTGRHTGLGPRATVQDGTDSPVG